MHLGRDTLHLRGYAMVHMSFGLDVRGVRDTLLPQPDSLPAPWHEAAEEAGCHDACQFDFVPASYTSYMG